MPAPTEESDLSADDQEDRNSLEDRGSFTHAVCRACGWAGPGRRSRGRARKDLAGHRENGCPRETV